MRDVSIIRVALVVPEKPLADVSPPLNLALLAAVISRKYPNATVAIFDGSVESNIFEKVRGFRADLVGVTAMTSQAYAAYDLAVRIKTLGVNRPYLVLGGVHASAFPEECLDRFDCVVVGEGEKAILDIIDRGFLFRGIIEGEPVDDLDSLPLPRFDLLKMNLYVNRDGYIPPLDVYPQIRITTSRGCPFGCPFCTNSKRRTNVRYHSAEYVFKMLKVLVTEYGIKAVWFYDDEFLANDKRIDDLCKMIALTGLRLAWACQARATTVKPHLLCKLKAAGCKCILFGIESASPRVLEYLKCGTISIAEVATSITYCKLAGIAVFGSFIFGTPDETLGDMNKTLDWVNMMRKHGLTCAGFSLMTPYPDTVIFDRVFGGTRARFRIDYDRMIATKDPRQAFITNGAVGRKDFAKFVKKAKVLFWVGNVVAMRNYRGLCTPSFVRALLRYPWAVLKIIWG